MSRAGNGEASGPARMVRIALFGGAAVVAVAVVMAAAVVYGWVFPTRNFADRAGPRFASCCVAAPERDPVRVVTFNIEHAEHIDGAIGLFRGADSVRDADIVALQEMDEDGVRRVASALSLGNHVYYPAAVSRSHGRNFGNAILSRWPIEEDGKLILPHLSLVGNMQRIATRATVRTGVGRRVRVYSMHLATVLEVGPAARRDQALAVIADAATSSDPVIIAGDTNAPGVWRTFEEHGFHCVTRGLGSTASVFALDHIFVRGLALAPASPLLSPSRGVVRGYDGVSDHRPVWATLERVETIPPAR